MTRPHIAGLVITMAGTPRPQPRARHVGGRVISNASPKARAFAVALQRAAREAVSNIGGEAILTQAWAGRALRVDILCEFATRDTTRWGRLHTHRPDKDNLEKMVLDALVRAGALGGDDSRAATGTTTKVWAETGRISVTIRPAPDNPNTTRKTAATSALKAPPSWLRR